MDTMAAINADNRSMTPAEFVEARRQLGLTQVELAAQLGVASNTVSRWELRNRKIPLVAVKLLRAMMAGLT